VVGALAIGGGIAVAVAIVTNPIMSDHQTHVLPTKGAFTLVLGTLVLSPLSPY